MERMMPSKDSIPRSEIDAEPTEATPSPHGKTTPHASVDWMAGFDEGRQRGAAEILEALEAALVSVGVGDEVAKLIVSRVRARAEQPDK
jgi:hypothetical protein